MRPLKSIERFFQNSQAPEEFIQDHRDAIIAHLDEQAFQRIYKSNFRLFIIFFPLVVGGLNYTKNSDSIMLVYWGLFAVFTAVAVTLGGRRKTERSVRAAKYVLEVISGTAVIITAILAGHSEMTGLVTRGGPIQFAFIIQAANPYWFDREKLVMRGLLLGVMAYFFAAQSFPEFYSILISQILIGVPVSVTITLFLNSSEIDKVYIGTLAEKENQKLRTDIAHAWSQLQRLVHPHQFQMLKLGHVLEDTMNLEKKLTHVAEFDFKSSSKLTAIDGYDLHKSHLFRDLSNKFLYNRYAFAGDWEDFSTPVSDGYFFKDMGDGFVYMVGHPFRSEHPNHGDLSVDIAFKMIQYSQNYMYERLGVEPRMCIAIVRCPTQGLWKSANVTGFDFTDESIIPSARLGAFRRELEKRGLIERDASQILITQEVYSKLSAETKAIFTGIELRKFSMSLRESADDFVYAATILPKQNGIETDLSLRPSANQ